MSTPTRREYLRVLSERYRNSLSKNDRSRLIDEAVLNTGLHRKSIVRALNRPPEREQGLPPLGRPRHYSAAGIELLKRLYRASEYACSDKLKFMIPELLHQWRAPVDVVIREEVLRMSPASMDRYLRQYRGIERRRHNSRARPGSRLFKNSSPSRVSA